MQYKEPEKKNSSRHRRDFGFDVVTSHHFGSKFQPGHSQRQGKQGQESLRNPPKGVCLTLLPVIGADTPPYVSAGDLVWG